MAHVCVLTGKGPGAIGSAALFGQGAADILSGVFKPAGGNSAVFEPGRLIHGSILDDSQILDQVVIGCEQPDFLTICTHGNVLILEQIIRLLVSAGAQTADYQTMLQWRHRRKSLFAIEAITAQSQSLTLEGVATIQVQSTGGLTGFVRRMLDAMPSIDIEQVHQQAGQVLSRSRVAMRIIHGVRIVLAGPPNSGKSTLLNAMAQSRKAIVSDIAGTTRDWVSVSLLIGALRAEVIDTAGLASAAIGTIPDAAAQELTRHWLDRADLVLEVGDISNPQQLTLALPETTARIRVWNKADLVGNCPPQTPDSVILSAKNNSGLDSLYRQIQAALGCLEWDTTQPACFTQRQIDLLEKVCACQDKDTIHGWMESLTA